MQFPGERNGTPLQCSCLENPTDGGAWWAAAHGVPESDTAERLHSLACHGVGSAPMLLCVQHSTSKIVHNVKNK